MPASYGLLAVTDEAGKYRTHITVLSLLKDETGRVVGKLSRDVQDSLARGSEVAEEALAALEGGTAALAVAFATRGAMAGSAGTLITLAGHAAAMAPETMIGAASVTSTQLAPPDTAWLVSSVPASVQSETLSPP